MLGVSSDHGPVTASSRPTSSATSRPWGPRVEQLGDVGQRVAPAEQLGDGPQAGEVGVVVGPPGLRQGRQQAPVLVGAHVAGPSCPRPGPGRRRGTPPSRPSSHPGDPVRWSCDILHCRQSWTVTVDDVKLSSMTERPRRRPPPGGDHRRRLRRPRPGPTGPRRRHDDLVLLAERGTTSVATWRDKPPPGLPVRRSVFYFLLLRFQPRLVLHVLPQPEIQAHLGATALPDEDGLRPSVWLGTTVEAAAWDEERRTWVIDTSAGRHEAEGARRPRTAARSAGNRRTAGIIPGVETFEWHRAGTPGWWPRDGGRRPLGAGWRWSAPAHSSGSSSPRPAAPPTSPCSSARRRGCSRTGPDRSGEGLRSAASTAGPRSLPPARMVAGPGPCVTSELLHGGRWAEARARTCAGTWFTQRRPRHHLRAAGRRP